MNDLISRSELIAQLEGLKISLGDVVLGFVVDRVIERVKDQPAVQGPAIVIRPDRVHIIPGDDATEVVLL